MSKRKYRKRSDYWKKFDKSPKETLDQLSDSFIVGPSSTGEPFYSESIASYSRTENNIESSVSRRNTAHKSNKKNRFSNISGGMLPYVYGRDGVNVRDAIELCQKAYANIAVFRNAIDVMSEFANSKIFLEGGTQKSRDFVYKWFEKINLWNLKDQYFREYYRSGNIFMYRVDGKFSTNDFEKMGKIYGSELSLKPAHLPVKYIMLNPFDIVVNKGSSFETGLYEKILSEYDIERLKNPKTEYDIQVLEALDEETKNKIASGKYNSDGIRIKLDPGHLVYSFYKKQDYEPFAVPFGYPVLDDINFKLELKKIDQAICRTIENVILLITMGNEPDKGGINPRNMEAMQNLFKNESVGRVLVSDYTTEAKFIIPDIAKVVGPNKYEVINNDIKEGLQNVIVGDERYSNTQVKAKIFLERLEESRNAFVYDFLQPQVKMICKNLGFRKYPEVKFEQVDIKDEVQLQRVVTRLMELGIITPEQGVNVLETGCYPKSDELKNAQQIYLKEREEGLYNPLVGGAPVNSQTNQNSKERRDVKKETGRPTGTSEIPQESKSEVFSRDNIKEIIYSSEKLSESAYSLARKRFKKKRLNKAEKDMLDNLCETIILSSERETWDLNLDKCLENCSVIDNLNVLKDIENISNEFNLDLYSSSLLYHSAKEV
jgi:hypothetical protein